MIYKNKRHHPDRVFVVTSIKPVKIGKVRTSRIYGLELKDGQTAPVEATYLLKDFDAIYPIIMWAPAG